MKRWIAMAVALSWAFILTAQWDSLQYPPIEKPLGDVSSPDLQEGLYLTAKDLLDDRPSIPVSTLVDKHGNPIPWIIDSTGKTWRRKVYQRIGDGERKTYRMKRLWGFCDRDHVYVKVPPSFQTGFKWFEVYYHRTITPLVRCPRCSFPDPPIRTTSEMFVLDMRTGTIYEVHADNMPELIGDDPVLLLAYSALPEIDRRSNRVIRDTIKRYNEAHPFIFPR